jgi:uncharacterized protein YPO0396
MLFRDTAILWFCQNAINLTERDLAEEQSQQNIDTAKRNELDIHIKNQEDDIEDLRSALAQDSANIRLQSLETKINQSEKDKNIIQDNLEKYQNNAIIINSSIPKTISQFEKNRLYAEKYFEDCRKNIVELEKHWEKIVTEKNSIANNITFLTEELASLSGRQSNIPLENLRIREMICRGIKCSEDDIPFAGELIQTSPDEEYWSLALEKLLHHFALSLIVPESLYKKVNSFVHSNNLKGRVVYFKADEHQILMSQKSSSKLASGKLQVKQEHPLATWVREYINRRFDFLCTDNMNDFAHAEKALTSSALIKSKDRHEKDDRERSAFSAKVLGWNNREKRQELSAQLESFNVRKISIDQ